MKKSIIALAMLLLLAFLVMPYVTGRVAESATQQAVEQLNSMPSQYGTLAFQKYERGMRATDLQFSWTPMGAGAEPISYDCDARHGMFNFTYECQAVNLPKYTEFINQHLNGNDPLTVGGEVSVFGEISKRLDLKAFDMVDEKGSKIEVESGYLTLHTDQELSFVEFSGEFDGLQVKGQDEEVFIGAVEASGKLDTNQYNLLVGDLEIDIEELSGIDEQGAGSVKDLELTIESEEQGDDFVFTHLMQVGSLSIPAETGGTSKLEDLELATQISGINMRTFSKVLSMLKELAVAPETSSNALKLSIVPELEKLLAPGLQLAIDTSAETDGDDFEFNLNAELNDNLSMGDFVLLAVNPQAVLSKADVGMNSRFPKSLYEDNPAATADFSASAWFVEDRNHYRSDFQLEDGQITLNGENLTFEELLALANQ